MSSRLHFINGLSPRDRERNLLPKAIKGRALSPPPRPTPPHPASRATRATHFDAVSPLGSPSRAAILLIDRLPTNLPASWRTCKNSSYSQVTFFRSVALRLSGREMRRQRRQQQQQQQQQRRRRRQQWHSLRDKDTTGSFAFHLRADYLALRENFSGPRSKML
jgi:hypothetical protein